MFAYPVQPLFSGNQNVYFLWGMAKTGIGSLPLDPLLQQADPFPLFSALVFIVFKIFKPWFVHILYGLLCVVYSYSVFGIVDHVQGIYKRQLLPFTSLFLVLHCSEFWGSFLRLTWDLDLRWIWDSGLAEQGMLRGYLQPSVFGVFLMLALYRFLKNDVRGTFLSLAVAGIFHANYLFIGGIMAVVFFEHFVRSGSIRQTVIWSVVAISVVLPYLLYTVSQFVPTAINQNVLIDSAVKLTEKDNPHLDLFQWMNAKTVLQLLVLGVFLLAFRKLRVGRIALILTVIFGCFSFVAFTLDSTILKSLNPWRISIILIPISSMLVFWKLFSNPKTKPFSFAVIGVFTAAIIALVFYRTFGNSDMTSTWRIATLAGMFLIGIIGFWLKQSPVSTSIRTPIMGPLILLCITTGIFGTYMESRFRSQSQQTKAVEFIRKTSTTKRVFIIPTDQTSFRLTAECAIVADNNLVYGLSLADQLQRISDVTELYDQDWTDEEQLLKFCNKHQANSILVPSSKSLPKLLILQKTYFDSHYAILELLDN